MYKDAEINSDVCIQLLETNLLKTVWISIDIVSNEDFEKGSTDVFNIKTKDIEFPKLIRIS